MHTLGVTGEFNSYEGANVVAVVSSPGSDDCKASGPQDSSSKWTTTGVAIDGLVASAIDGLVLAHDVQPSTTVRARNQLLKVQAFPQVMVLRDGFGLGYSARF
ncbi:MAG: hypothetical protein ABI488_05835 [Polyangiaceae bacterium]